MTTAQDLPTNAAAGAVRRCLRAWLVQIPDEETRVRSGSNLKLCRWTAVLCLSLPLVLLFLALHWIPRIRFRW